MVNISSQNLIRERVAAFVTTQVASEVVESLYLAKRAYASYVWQRYDAFPEECCAKHLVQLMAAIQQLHDNFHANGSLEQSSIDIVLNAYSFFGEGISSKADELDWLE